MALASGAPPRPITELLNRSRRTSVLKGDWGKRLGALPGRVSLQLYGGPGSYKSTAATQLAGELADSGKRVIYLASEEGYSPSLVDRFERLEVRSPLIDIWSGSHLPGILERALSGDYDAVVLDSYDAVTGIQPHHVSMISQTRQVPLVIVSQGTKAGDAAGPQAISHLVDVVVRFEDGQAHVTKNRFGPLVAFPVLTQEVA